VTHVPVTTMRTRYENSPVLYKGTESCPYTSWNWDNGQQVGNGNLTSPDAIRTYSQAAITDDDTSPGRNTKYCHHTRKKYELMNLTSCNERSPLHPYAYITVSGDWAFYSRWPVHENGGGDISIGSVSTLYRETLVQHIRRAIEKFHEVNVAENDINLTELDDFVVGLRNIRSNMNKARTSMGSTAYRKLTGLLKYGGGVVGGSWLYYVFGIAPGLKDLKATDQFVQNFKNGFERYMRNLRKRYVIHVKSYGNFDSLHSLPTHVGPIGNSSYELGAKIMPTMIPTRIVTVAGKRFHKYYNDYFNRWQYVLDKLGSNGPLSMAWEKLPFSFVVDWFVDLHAVMNFADAALTSGQSEHIDDVGWSEKWSCIVPAYRNQYSTYITSQDGQVVAQNEFQYYHREAVDLKQFQLVGLSGKFGKRQAATAAALLHQIVANLKR